MLTSEWIADRFEALGPPKLELFCDRLSGKASPDDSDACWPWLVPTGSVATVGAACAIPAMCIFACMLRTRFKLGGPVRTYALSVISLNLYMFHPLTGYEHLRHMSEAHAEEHLLPPCCNVGPWTGRHLFHSQADLRSLFLHDVDLSSL